MNAIRPKGSRIEVAEVRAAYELTGVRAVRGSWFDAPETRSLAACGCPATVVAACRSGDPANYLARVRDALVGEHKLAAEGALGLSEDYVAGFTSGVDDLDEGERGEETDFDRGIRDGCAVRRALWGAT